MTTLADDCPCERFVERILVCVCVGAHRLNERLAGERAVRAVVVAVVRIEDAHLSDQPPRIATRVEGASVQCHYRGEECVKRAGEGGDGNVCDRRNGRKEYERGYGGRRWRVWRGWEDER